MQTFSIGQLANLAGVPRSTLRFYERSGLIKPDFRTGANYRGYGTGSLRRLQFIRSAQATGLSLQDIQAMLDLARAEKPACDEVLSVMDRRLRDIRQRIEDLSAIEKELSRTLESCCKGQEKDICRDMCQLADSNCVDCV